MTIVLAYNGPYTQFYSIDDNVCRYLERSYMAGENLLDYDNVSKVFEYEAEGYNEYNLDFQSYNDNNKYYGTEYKYDYSSQSIILKNAVANIGNRIRIEIYLSSMLKDQSLINNNLKINGELIGNEIVVKCDAAHINIHFIGNNNEKKIDKMNFQALMVITHGQYVTYQVPNWEPENLILTSSNNY